LSPKKYVLPTSIFIHYYQLSSESLNVDVFS